MRRRLLRLVGVDKSVKVSSVGAAARSASCEALGLLILLLLLLIMLRISLRHDDNWNCCSVVYEFQLETIVSAIGSLLADVRLAGLGRSGVVICVILRV